MCDMVWRVRTEKYYSNHRKLVESIFLDSRCLTPFRVWDFFPSNLPSGTSLIEKGSRGVVERQHALIHPSVHFPARKYPPKYSRPTPQ